ncbi:hypothetical protein BHM03_00045995, partial [Ensete ventricosum]
MEDDESAVKASEVVAAANEEATVMEDSVGGGGGGRGGEEEEVEDDVEGEEEEEDEEEEDEDEGYTLRFDGDTDPLGLVQEDNHGVDLYQQFERLEYEALAERKRKAVSQKEPPRKKEKRRRKNNLAPARGPRPCAVVVRGSRALFLSHGEKDRGDVDATARGRFFSRAGRKIEA